MTPLPELEPAALEACPFCNGEPQLIDGGPGNLYVRCVQCGATGDDGSRDYALSHWNRRAARSVPEAGKAVACGEDEMPERIWAGDFDENGFGHCVAGMQGGLYAEYVRADLASVPAPSGAEPVRIAGNTELLQQILDTFGPSPDGAVERDLAAARAAPQAVPAEEIAGESVGFAYQDAQWIDEGRWHLCKTEPNDIKGRKVETVFLGSFVASLATRLEASEAEATSLRRKLEEAERERDAMVRGLSALVHCQSALSRRSMRGAAADLLERLGRKPVDLGGDQSPFVARAETAERALEEHRKALEPFAAIADEYADQEDDDFQVWKDFDVLGATLPLKHFRAARRILGASE